MTALLIVVVAVAFAAGWLASDCLALTSGRFVALPPAHDKRRKRLGLAARHSGCKHGRLIETCRDCNVDHRPIRERTIGCRCSMGLGECRMHFEARGGVVDDGGRVTRDPLHGRLTDAIGKLGADAEPKPGWIYGVWARVRGSWRRG